jgi:hypothetical protein
MDLTLTEEILMHDRAIQVRSPAEAKKFSYTIQTNTKALLDASKEVGLEVNPEKTKYMLVSRCQKAGQRQSIKMGIGPLKAWQSSNIWEQHLQIKIVFMKRLRAD